MKKKKLHASNIVLIVCLLPLLSMLITGIISGKPTIFGIRPFFIMTDSMIPTIPVHSVVYGIPVDAEEVEIGDIVAYTADYGWFKPTIIHRVVAIQDDFYIFKGDHNEKEDTPVSAGQIKYRIKKVIL